MKLLVLKFLAVFMLLGMGNAYASSDAGAHGVATEKTSKHKEETYQSKPFSEMIGGLDRKSVV